MPAAHALRHRDGAGADRRPDARRALPRARGSSTGSPSPARRSTRALELAATISANAPLALAASKEILQQAGDWTEEEFWAKQGDDRRAGLRPPRTPRRARRPSPRSASPCGRAADAAPDLRSTRISTAGRIAATAARGGQPSRSWLGPAADRGVRRRRVLDGGRQPAARRLRPRPDAPASGPRSASCRPPPATPTTTSCASTARSRAARCEPSHVSLFRRDKGAGRRTRDSTSTCSTRTSSTSAAAASCSLLGAWRAHGLDEVLAEAGAAASCCAA